MKAILILVLMATMTLTLTGCPDLQAFAKVVDDSNANWEQANDDLLALGGEVRAALEAYSVALKSEDTNEIEKAKYLLNDAQARYKNQEAAVEATKEAVERSIKQYKDAQAEGNYWWTIPGMVLGGVLGALGIKTKLGPAVGALSKTVSAIGNNLDKEQMEAFKADQRGSLTPAEKKAIAKALGKA